jgi:18S rRNA (guanine1575-N7)-methyltransferase
VLQIYPQNSAQAEMMVSAAMKVGFSGGLVIDFPHSTRAKKYFMVLMVGTSRCGDRGLELMVTIALF